MMCDEVHASRKDMMWEAACSFCVEVEIRTCVLGCKELEFGYFRKWGSEP